MKSQREKDLELELELTRKAYRELYSQLLAVRSLDSEIVVQKALRFLRRKEGDPELLDRKLSMHLSDIDPFWIRWSDMMERMQENEETTDQRKDDGRKKG